jgi:hypothetical protein
MTLFETHFLSCCFSGGAAHGIVPKLVSQSMSQYLTSIMSFDTNET